MDNLIIGGLIALITLSLPIVFALNPLMMNGWNMGMQGNMHGSGMDNGMMDGNDCPMMNQNMMMHHMQYCRGMMNGMNCPHTMHDHN